MRDAMEQGRENALPEDEQDRIVAARLGDRHSMLGQVRIGFADSLRAVFFLGRTLLPAMSGGCCWEEFL